MHNKSTAKSWGLFLLKTLFWLSVLTHVTGWFVIDMAFVPEPKITSFVSTILIWSAVTFAASAILLLVFGSQWQGELNAEAQKAP